VYYGCHGDVSLTAWSSSWRKSSLHALVCYFI